MKKLILLLLLLFVIVTPGFTKQSGDINTVVNGIQKQYEQIKDLHATFTQEATVKALNKVQKAQGEVWLKKPGKMRWNYSSPTKDEIVSNGTTLWFYNEEEKQVIESPMSQVTQPGSASSLLSGFGNITELFDTSFSEDKHLESTKNYLIDLMPKGEEDYNKVTISVNKDSMLVESMYLYDPYGNLTIVKLGDIEIDRGVADSLFNFTVPSGVEVITPPSPASR